MGTGAELALAGGLEAALAGEVLGAAGFGGALGGLGGLETALGGEILGAAGFGGEALGAAAAGGFSMPPAIIGPEVSGFVPTGTTAGGGTVFGPGAEFNPLNIFQNQGVPGAESNVANTAFDLEGAAFSPGGTPNTFAPPNASSTFTRSVDSLKSLPWGAISSGLNIGSGVLGLGQSDRMRKMAERAFNAQDPFGSQRAMYQQRLNALQSNPSTVTGLPGYQFGIDEGRRAIERQGAGSGSGGNEAIALARYTPEYAQKFYDAEMSRLMQLSGANIGPSGGGSLLQGNQFATDAMSRALASIGYGVNRMAGPDPVTQALIERLSRGA